MKSFLALIISVLLSLQLFAQQNHFIYIQTDNRQPFYVKANGKVFSSSSSGYAIISKLSKGDLQVRVGFPKNEWPEQTININVQGDAGFLLKNFQEQGWGLYNMQTMQVAMNGNNSAPTHVTPPETTTAAPTKELAVAQTPVSQNETQAPAKPTTVPEIPLETGATPPASSTASKAVEPARTETVPNTDNNTFGVIKTVQVPPPAKDNKEPGTSTPVTQAQLASNNEGVATNTGTGEIKKLYSINEADGKAVVYVDNPVQYKDTVKIKLQQESQQAAKAEVPAETAINSAATPTASTANTTPTDSRFLDLDMSGARAKTESQADKPAKEKKEKKSKKTDEPYVPVTTEKSAEFPQEGNKETKEVQPKLNFNSDCKNLATEDDFYKLRRRLASFKSEDNMVAESAKYFRQKCYTSEQVKFLAVMFMTDEGRYRFFDASYPFISDPKNFHLLESELKDEYYKNRFNAMIKK